MSDRRLTDPRGIGVGFVVALIVVVTIDRMVPLGGIGQVVAGTRLSASLPLGQRMLVGAVAAATTGACLVAARLWLRTRWARRRAWVTVMTFLVAAQVGIATSGTLLSGLLGSDVSVGAPFDYLSLLTGIALLLHLLFGMLGRHRDTVAALRATEDELRDAATASERALAEERASLTAEVRTLLEARLGQDMGRGLMFTGARLRELADGALRPLSHRLSERDAAASAALAVGRASLRVGAALRGLQVRPVVRPRLLTVVMVLLTFRLSVTTRPPESASTAGPSGATLTVDWASLLGSLAQHAIVLAVVLVGTRLSARRLGTTGSRHHALRQWVETGAGVVGIAGALFLALRVVQLVPDFIVLRPTTPALVAGFALPLVLIIAGSSLLVAVEQQLGRNERELDDANRRLARHVARIDALLVHERRRFARRLHSTVQAAVNAAALLLERDVLERDADASTTPSPATLSRAATLIGDAVAGLDEDDAIGTAERLAAIVTAWEDLCTVRIDADEMVLARLDADPPAKEALSDLVAEACSNSVVHGSATSVHVRITAQDDTIMLLVEDDGRARHESDDRGGDDGGSERRTGLGTRILTTTCTEWALEHRDDGTTLTATLPLAG
jgi:signal transduction histidine kinase